MWKKPSFKVSFNPVSTLFIGSYRTIHPYRLISFLFRFEQPPQRPIQSLWLRWKKWLPIIGEITKNNRLQHYQSETAIESGAFLLGRDCLEGTRTKGGDLCTRTTHRLHYLPRRWGNGRSLALLRLLFFLPYYYYGLVYLSEAQKNRL